MGNLTTIRQGILDILTAADPSAFVQDYEAWSIDDDPESILMFFQTRVQDYERAWVFKPVAITEATRTRGCNQVSYVFAFRMVDDIVERRTTAETWEVIATVRQAFRDNPTLNGSCFSTKVQIGGGEADSGLQVEKVDFFQLDNRKVQYGEFTLTAHDLVAG